MTQAIYDVRLLNVTDPYNPNTTIRVLAINADTARAAANLQPNDIVREIIEIARL